MNNFSHFPVFEANQVLRNDHLNDLVSYLEEQNRLTRNQMIGVGILCGFKLEFDSARDLLLLSEGVGITSKGYLISSGPEVFAGIKPYTLGAPDGSNDGELTQLEMDIFNNEPYTERISLYRELAEVYEFFKDPLNPNALSDMQELIREEDMEVDSTRLDIADLDGKVLLAYVKLDLESLKNCTIQDCNDKGARLRFTHRYLVMDSAIADFILNKEREKHFTAETEENRTKRPIHLSQHAKYSLPPAKRYQYSFAERPPRNLPELAKVHLSSIEKTMEGLKEALIESTQTYRYVLQGIYPQGDAFAELIEQFVDNSRNANDNAPEQVQYHYDFMVHLLEAYEEFRQAAFAYEAECLPHDSYFPRHLFLGQMNHLDSDLQDDFKVRSSFILTGRGFVPTELPDKYRHYFTPSPAFDRQNKLVEKLMALHYRMDRMLRRFNANHIIQKTIQVIPGLGPDENLSKRAIPGYFKVPQSSTLDDLLRVWSYEKTTSNTARYIRSYHRVQGGTHPLRVRQGSDDFYRIEGHIGNQLNRVASDLFDYRQDFALDFGIKLAELGDTLSRINLSSTLFQNFVGQHPGLAHLAGVPKGGTFVLVFQRNKSGNPIVVADFALPYNCCSSDSGRIIQECTYKWISSKRYLRNIARPWHGTAKPQKRYHYTIQVMDYTIGQVSMMTGKNKAIKIPVSDVKRYGLRAVTDALNQSFPNGLVFGVNKAGRLTIRKYYGQTFRIELKERNNDTRFVYTHKGRQIIGKNIKQAYSDADCRIIPPQYNANAYQALHRIYGASFYEPNFLLNTDWKVWNKYLEDRAITTIEDERLKPVQKDLNLILKTIVGVDRSAKVALVGSWAQGTWVSKETLKDQGAAEFLEARQKILGKTGVSDLDILIQTKDRVVMDKVSAVLEDLVLEYKVSAIFGRLSSQGGEVIRLN